MKESKLKNTLHDCLHNRNLMIGLVILLSIIVIAIFADSIAPFPYNKNSVGGRLEAPSAAHWFGTDEMGRDMFSRVIGGTRITLWICFLGAALQLVIGVAVGLISGYFGKWVDRVFSFMTDLTWCIPGTILALTVVTLLGKGLTNSIIAISLVSWASYARPVRAKTMALRNMAFVETGISFGESSFSIITRYILPNVLPSLIVMVSTNLPSAILSPRHFPSWALVLRCRRRTGDLRFPTVFPISAALRGSDCFRDLRLFIRYSASIFSVKDSGISWTRT